MTLAPVDWIIVALSVAVAFVPALLLARRAGRSVREFFTSGRSAPWWLIGVSMVATTFSTGTPNLVTHFVRERGVSYNWMWWSFLLTGILTVFFYARMWRRSGVLTDLEFYEIRYSGRAASVVRGFRAVYLGLVFNCVVMAAVNLAAAKIANVLFGWPLMTTLLLGGALNIFFAATSGLWGVMVTDLIQFGIAMSAAFFLAYFALQQPEVGGLSGLLEKTDPALLGMLPDFSDWGLTLTVFIIPLTVQWWAVWYPGSEPGGGSYIAQRMLAARSEKDAMAGTLLFNVAHYAIRPWPWILTGLASLYVFPELEDIRRAFPHVDPKMVGHDMAYPAMFKFLPPGYFGLMVAGMLAAYVSTITTHLNWGSSYLVHDCYRRFVTPNAGEKHYVLVSRLTTGALMLAAGGLTFLVESQKHGFELMTSIGAGTGLLYLLRWFWWRVNAWAEVAAMVSSFTVTACFFIARQRGADFPAHHILLYNVALTTAVWVSACYLAPATDRETLLRFYRLVRPAGPGWRRLRQESGLPASPDSLPQAMLGWVLGCLFVYAGLFGAGSFIYGATLQALLWTAVFLLSGTGVVLVLRGIWSVPTQPDLSEASAEPVHSSPK